MSKKEIKTDKNREIKKNWTIRKYRAGDETQINDLFNSVFEKSRPLKDWRWKYADNPFMSTQSLSNLITVVESNGLIVALYSNSPVIFKMGDSLLRFAQPVDIIIHPDFQGVIKLLREIANFEFTICSFDDGIQVGFGFPNEIYYPVGKRFLRYKDLCRMPTLLKRLNIRLAVRKRLPFLPSLIIDMVQSLSNRIFRASLFFKDTSKGIRIIQIERFDSRIDRLWEIAKDRYAILAFRDSRFLNWRFIENPDGPYCILVAEENGETKGYVVLKVKKETDKCIGYIVDILSISQKIDEELINAALKYFLREKADYALCRVLIEDELSNSLTKFGFRERGFFKPIPVVYMIFPDNFDESFLKDLKKWHLTYCDHFDVEF
jgi:hypothetical protein